MVAWRAENVARGTYKTSLLRELALRGLLASDDGQKQWYIEQIAQAVGIDLEAFRAELETDGRKIERGVAP